MKFTVEELLLAANIRPIASDLRKAAFAGARKAAERQAQEAAEAARTQHLSKMKTFEQDWHANNPLGNFVKPALAELEQIAAAIMDA